MSDDLPDIIKGTDLDRAQLLHDYLKKKPAYKNTRLPQTPSITNTIHSPQQIILPKESQKYNYTILMIQCRRL